jgi:sterol desaturase/sphingolipid hydroxylase (fatty acid hydroxylase superfamily)
MKQRAIAGEPLRWGEGRISGYLSAALGLLCLGGVLCFHFPWLLTTPDLVRRLSVDHLRGLLLFCLVLAFGLGLINFLINRCRHLGFIGMGSAALAVLLGGHTVQPGVRPALSLLPLGLDAFILGLLFYALLFIPLEKAFPRIREQVILRPKWRDDLAYFAMANLLVSVLMVVVTASGPVLFGWAVSPGLHRLMASQPFPVQFLEMVLIADLAQYVSHRWYHTNRSLWRIHAVHHSVETMDWLAGSRLHLLEVLLTRVAVFVPLYLLGFSQEVLYTYIAFVSIHAVFIHANVGIDFGWLRYVVATPQFHHWHHSDDPQVRDKNFAVHLPVLDMLFGTYYQPPGKWPPSYGLIGQSLPDGILAQHLHPFRKRKK